MKIELDRDYYFEYSGYKLKTLGFDAEWLLPDGLGGYASQILYGSCARRYHSLYLINTPQGRINILPQIEEFIKKDTLIPLSTNTYADVIYPEGYLNIEKVYVGPSVCYEYRIGESIVRKEIFKPQAKRKTYIRYSLLGEGELKIIQIPLFSGTSYHCLRGKTDEQAVICSKLDNCLELKLSSFHAPLYLSHSLDGSSGFNLEDNQDWYYNFRLKKEEERGLDFSADFYSAIKITSLLNSKRDVIFCISDSREQESIVDSYYKDYEEMFLSLKKKRKKSANKIKESKILSHNKDSFYISTMRNSRGVVAGYHWFEEWGRDTFISLSLLTREDLADEAFINHDVLSIYKDFLAHSKNGIMPNRFFSDPNSSLVSGAEYNSVDSLLWAICSLYKIWQELDEKNIFREEWLKLCANLDLYIQGTDYQIFYDESTSLLYAGDYQTQLTWMDARVDGVPVTPRFGACVEINALFYNALRILSKICAYFDNQTKAANYEELSHKVYNSFRASFLLLDKGYLADRILKDGEKDLSFRPNQIFSMSLPFPLLTKREGRIVLQKIEKELLTSFGLRTLSRGDKNYRPIYSGGVYERDSAYHQGTVWPWLLGPYADAVINFGESDFRPKLEKTLDSLVSHVNTGGIGYVSEVFGGDDDKSGGAVAQCWSVFALAYCLEKFNS